MVAKRSGSGRKAGLSEAPPHYHGHLERLHGRFREAGSDALSDFELLELVLFRAIPQRDVKPLAKALIANLAPLPKSSQRRRRGLRKSRASATRRSPSSRWCTRRAGSPASRCKTGRCCRHGQASSTTAAPPWPMRTRSSFAAVPRQAQPTHRRRIAADRHRGSHAGLSARGGQARARIIRHRADLGA